MEEEEEDNFNLEDGERVGSRESPLETAVPLRSQCLCNGFRLLKGGGSALKKRLGGGGGTDEVD